MNAVGIDVSKGKSTVAVLRPFGEVAASPFNVDVRSWKGVWSSVLKIKPCKRNNHQNSDHTKDAAKEGNAEEQPDAGCGIKR